MKQKSFFCLSRRILKMKTLRTAAAVKKKTIQTVMRFEHFFCTIVFNSASPDVLNINCRSTDR